MTCSQPHPLGCCTLLHAPGPHQQRARAALIALCASAALLTGCASFSPDGGMGRVEQTTRERIGKEVRSSRTADDQLRIDERVTALLGQPLSEDHAVQIALLNNRGLQASFQQLGFTEADLVRAGRLPNPSFSFGRLTRGREVEIDRGLHINLARVLLMPWLIPIEQRRFEQSQTLTAQRVLSLATDTRKAWLQALAAQESLRYARQIRQAADASADLARRMEQVGNFNALMRAREQVFAADARLALTRAEHARLATRERLIRLMGLAGEQTAFTLPERLPDLPATPVERTDLERTALAQRLDVQAAAQAAEQTARNLGLTRATGFVNLLEFGGVRNSASDAPVQQGWELAIELPLFDAGGVRQAKAQALYQEAVHRAAETAVNARSEVREAYAAYRAAHDIARRHQEEIVPLRQQIAQENLLRYNGMLIGVFELLADARAQIASVNAAIEAKRDFWLAQADLDSALTGKPALMPLSTRSASPDAAAGPAH